MGREPTPEELGERLEMPEDKVRKVLKIAKEPISMETPIGDDDDSHLGDFIEDGTILLPIDSATGEGLIEATSFHDDDLVPWDPARPNDDLDPKSETYTKLRAIKKTLDRAGLAVNTATCSLHGNAIFRKGGLTNPDPKLRALARKKVERTLRIGAFFGAKHYTYWVARDGFEVPVNVNWKKSLLVAGRRAEQRLRLHQGQET